MVKSIIKNKPWKETNVVREYIPMLISLGLLMPQRVIQLYRLEGGFLGHFETQIAATTQVS